MSDNPFLQPKFRFTGLIEIGLFAAITLTLCDLGARLWWVFDSVSQFKVQFSIILLIGSLFLIREKRKKLLILTGICFLYNVLWIIPLYFPATNPQEKQTSPIRIMTFNIHSSNKKRSEVMQYLRQSKADIVVLHEITSVWQKAFSSIIDIYPYQKGKSRGDNFGIFLLSRIPPTKFSLEFFGEAYVPTIIAEFQHQKTTFTFIGTHPLPPRNSEYSKMRNEQLFLMAKHIKTIANPVVLAGDLNTTSWSPYFRDFVAATKLLDSRQGYGVCPTWPSILSLLWIPIDHCLISPNSQIHKHQIGPHHGSDHYPVVVDISFPRR